MFRKQRPDKEAVAHAIEQFPHCDQRVLHAPGECRYCDIHPNWQALRLAWGIAFTGWEPEEHELPCPATLRRSVEVINRWSGNTPQAPKPDDLNPEPEF